MFCNIILAILIEFKSFPQKLCQILLEFLSEFRLEFNLDYIDFLLGFIRFGQDYLWIILEFLLRC